MISTSPGTASVSLAAGGRGQAELKDLLRGRVFQRRRHVERQSMPPLSLDEQADPAAGVAADRGVAPVELGRSQAHAGQIERQGMKPFRQDLDGQAPGNLHALALGGGRIIGR